MRRVVDTDMVAHLWAHQSQDEARNKGGNFYFNGPTIYSYGSHFPIATFVVNKGRRCIFFTTRTYSTTTAKHLRMTRQAIPPGISVFNAQTVPTTKPNHQDNLKVYKGLIDSIVLQHKKSRSSTRISETRHQLTNLVREANNYAEFFGLKRRFEVPNDQEMQEKYEEEKRRRIAEERTLEKEKKENEKKVLTYLEDWKKGINRPNYPYNFRWYLFDEVYLRIKPNEPSLIETTKGAEFPLKHALKALPLIRSGKPYQRNGRSIHIGHFVIDSIDENGNVTAGCHYIKRSEIERLAQLLGV